jgi:hypothetical protein
LATEENERREALQAQSTTLAAQQTIKSEAAPVFLTTEPLLVAKPPTLDNRDGRIGPDPDTANF